ncbi:MAG: hypothetical protein JO140_04130 [Candidatus Eremiobacteraeota bacterium]|nr:hypothetical protein [Candidatus Eremiobacteraeota bacterium]
MNGNGALECRAMTGAERLDAFALYKTKIGDEAKLGAALALFVEREDLGMIWLALADGHAVAACTVSYEIGLREAAVVARIADVVVEAGLKRDAVARVLLESLRDWLHTRGITETNTERAL